MGGFSAFWLLWLLRGFLWLLWLFISHPLHSQFLSFASSALPVPLAFWLCGFWRFWLWLFASSAFPVGLWPWLPASSASQVPLWCLIELSLFRSSCDSCFVDSLAAVLQGLIESSLVP